MSKACAIIQCVNIACSGVRGLCPSSHIQAHIHIPDTAKGIGWIIRDGRAELLVVIRGKCPAIVRVVASGGPEARRKGLDDQVERSPPEALRPGGKV